MDKPGAAAIKMLTERLLNSTEPDEEITLPDGRSARIQHHPIEGVRATAVLLGSGVGLEMTMYEPSDVRLECYPESIPHIPDLAVFVTSTAEVTLAVWDGGSSSEEVRRLILEQLTNDGWEQSEHRNVLPGIVDVTPIERGGKKGALSSAMGSVSLMLGAR